MSDGIDTLNGTAYPEMNLQDEDLRTMRGGNGEQGYNKLGLPYAANAIGSGAVVSAKDTNKVRKGASFEGNRQRVPDYNDDRLQARR